MKEVKMCPGAGICIFFRMFYYHGANRILFDVTGNSPEI